MQAKITPISEIRATKDAITIHVRISRIWEHRGNSEQNAIKHLDMVLIDQKGHAIYSEIPPQLINKFKPYLEEGNIVYISKLGVEKAKPGYRVVDGPYKLKFGIRTEMIHADTDDTTFPKYVFSLTSIEDLSQYVGRTDRFLHVIGKIIAVSNAAVVRNASGDVTMRRVIKLEDHKGNAMDLSLQGQRALEFDGEAVLQVGQSNHIIAIFTERYQCTATLISISDNQHWCYQACKVCYSKMIPGTDGYQCTKVSGCPCTQFDWKYKVSFVGADDTHSLEFMFFEKKGAELIGKSAETLRKQYEPSTIPPEISQWIGHKFTFIVKVLSKKSAHSIDPSFEVLLIKERHGKQATLPTIRYKTSIRQH
ncbi:uncharacterized protein LOC120682675 isoform X3 [Panicum virgatum]|uniref:uncharacterized protein LOC120682675 isoform X3 n=1 Tax=Panicum virgatum TaxID=38727 RepID=UPI0019D56656|nr:uncharacterized protein LOC120682675 isoform X3 [Panicum virgatum]